MLGLIAAGFVLGVILKLCGKHEETCNNIKQGGKNALLWWLTKK